RREAKAVVIGRVADENDRAVAPPTGGSKRMAHERAADAAVAAIFSDGHRSEKQSGRAGAAHDLPGANDPPAIHRAEREVIGRPLPVTQALRAFAPAAIAEGLVEQRLARPGVRRSFFSY